MARVNVYLPDGLADEARRSGLNISNVTQDALRRELAGHRTSEWLAQLRRPPRAGVTHDEVLGALDEVRAEAGDDWPEGPQRG